MSSGGFDTLAKVLGFKRVGFEVRVAQCLGVTPNQVRRWHWNKTRKEVSRVRRSVRLVLARFEKPDLPLLVTMTRCSVGTLDDDGAVGSMKNVRDEIASWLGINDNDPRVTWKVGQRKVSRKEAGTLIRIEPRAD